MKIPFSMIEISKNSFSNVAIRGFLGKRPIVEWLSQQANSFWNLSMPCLLSLIDNEHFLFRFSSKEDRDSALKIPNTFE